VLCCVVLCCVLCCVVLCVVLCCVVCCVVLCCVVLCCVGLCCVVLCCVVLGVVSLHLHDEAFVQLERNARNADCVLVLVKMQIKTGTDLLVITTSYKWEELTFLVGILALSLAVSQLFSLSPFLQIAFVALVIAGALLNVSGSEECTIDKKKGWVVIRKFGPFYGEKIYKKNLDELSDSSIEKLPKKEKYSRVVLLFKDGVRLPLTDIFFTKSEHVENVANTISNFIDN